MICIKAKNSDNCTNYKDNLATIKISNNNKLILPNIKNFNKENSIFNKSNIKSFYVNNKKEKEIKNNNNNNNNNNCKNAKIKVKVKIDNNSLPINAKSISSNILINKKLSSILNHSNEKKNKHDSCCYYYTLKNANNAFLIRSILASRDKWKEIKPYLCTSYNLKWGPNNKNMEFGLSNSKKVSVFFLFF